MKTDARVRYTKLRIREAFFRCLKEKPLNRITVKELCELAEINRATFYTHYADPYDLFEQLEAECLADMQRQIEAQREAGDVLTAILRGVRNPSSTAALLASANGDPGFAARITALYHRSFAPGLAERLPNCSEAELQSVYRFLAGGCGSLISRWMEEGMQTAPEEMAAHIGRLCSRFVETCKEMKEGESRT